jgi:uncharacterized protein
MSNPRLGASWEGFAMEQIIRVLPLQDVYFWSTYSGAELDLFFFHDSKRYGIEIKFSETPKITRSMHIAIQNLDLEHLWVVYSGRHIVPLEKKITLVPLYKIERMTSAGQVPETGIPGKNTSLD